MTRDKKPPAPSAPKAVSPRHKQENAERIFWNALNAKRFHGFKFFRNFAIGPHIANFVCLDAKLVVEIDAQQHVKGKPNPRADDLKQRGYGVLHFWNNDVENDIEGVLQALLKQLRKA